MLWHVPAGLRWHPKLTVVVATVLAIESLVFIGIHAKYREITPIIMSAMLGLLLAFVACPNRYANRCGWAYGRMVLVLIA